MIVPVKTNLFYVLQEIYLRKVITTSHAMY
jgi:hypothetical protein